MASRGKSAEGVACLAPPSGLRKVNSETNFAVSLLLAVSGDTAGAKRAAALNRPSANGSRRHDERSENSAGSTEVVTDSNDDSRRQSESPPLAVVPLQQQQRVMSNITQPHSPTLSVPRLPQSPNLSRSRAAASHGDGELFKYSYEERQAALRRFREKKRRRQFQKTVRYMVRKRLAETRPRYKGRFSKPPAAPTPDAEVPEGNREAGAKKSERKEEPQEGKK